MDCAAEEQLVRMALSDLHGLHRIEFNLEQRDVIIDHDTNTDTIASATLTTPARSARLLTPDANATPCSSLS